MSIRPIDMQVVVQKSTDVVRNHTQDSSNTNVAQQTFAQNLQKEVKQASEQVNQSNKSEQNNINQDGSSGNKYMSNKRRQKEKRENSDAEHEKRRAGSTSLFDMTI